VRLVLTIEGATIEFVRLNDDGPYPYLISTGTLRIAARAGQIAGLGVGESPSIEVLLQNNSRQAATLIGTPLRAAAQVYDSAGALFYDGIVSKVAHGKTMSLVLES